MALFDAMFEFSDAQAITADAQSTNILDWQAADREMGAGEPLYLNIRVGPDDFAGGSSLICTLHASTTTDIDATTEGTDNKILYQTGDIPQATLTAGYWIARISIPVDVDAYRYLGIQYNDTGGFTTGAINAWLDHGPQSSYDTQVATSNI
jgi:hypothetical protein